MKLWMFLLGCLLVATPLYAARSVIVEATGSACAAKGSVTEKTEQQALNSALVQAHGLAGGHVVSQLGTQDKDAEKQLRALYLQAPVRGLQPLRSEKYKDGSGHKCVRVQVRAEVAPDEDGEALLQKLAGDGPGSPLNVQVWSERPVYWKGEKINFFVKGNKSFFGSVVYTDAAENIVQILPNRYHPDSVLFEADKVYQLPAEEEFSIVVSPPAFGRERITVYGATVSLEELADIVPTGLVDGSAGSAPVKRRTAVTDAGKPVAAIEYVETNAGLATRAGD